MRVVCVACVAAAGASTVRLLLDASRPRERRQEMVQLEDRSAGVEGPWNQDNLEESPVLSTARQA